MNTGLGPGTSKARYPSERYRIKPRPTVTQPSAVVSRLYYADAMRRMGVQKRVSREISKLERHASTGRPFPISKERSHDVPPKKRSPRPIERIIKQPTEKRHEPIQTASLSSQDKLQKYSRDALIKLFSRTLMLISESPQKEVKSRRIVSEKKPQDQKLSLNLSKHTANIEELESSISKVRRLQAVNMSRYTSEIQRINERSPTRKFNGLLDSIMSAIGKKSVQDSRTSRFRIQGREPTIAITRYKNGQSHNRSAHGSLENRGIRGDIS